MTTEDRKDEAFLSRWSRRKQEAEKPEVPKPATPAPVLPPVESLTPDSDFKGFMDPRVGDALRRVALKKLFSDPHFNIPDPFEPYSIDFNAADTMSPAMVASLEQMKTFLKQPPEEKQAPQVPLEEKPQTDEPGKQDA